MSASSRNGPRWLALGLAAVLTAAAVSASGLISFVGLTIPHATRALVGPDHRRLLPAAALRRGGVSRAGRRLWPDAVVPDGNSRRRDHGADRRAVFPGDFESEEKRSVDRIRKSEIGNWKFEIGALDLDGRFRRLWRADGSCIPFPAPSPRGACSGSSGRTGRGRRRCFAFLAALCLFQPAAC